MRGKKTDVNQLEIIQILRQAGAVVCDLSAVGYGCPDLLVSYCGKNHLLEIKNPERQRFTQYQKEFYKRWKAPIHVVRSKTEALQAIGVITD